MEGWKGGRMEEGKIGRVPRLAASTGLFFKVA
jgi:hypothetical protein